MGAIMGADAGPLSGCSETGSNKGVDTGPSAAGSVTGSDTGCARGSETGGRMQFDVQYTSEPGFDCRYLARSGLRMRYYSFRRTENIVQSHPYNPRAKRL